VYKNYFLFDLKGGNKKMKKVIPELHLNDCAQAIEYYKDVFGAEVKNVQMADNVPGFENSKGKVLHAELFLSDDA